MTQRIIITIATLALLAAACGTESAGTDDGTTLVPSAPQSIDGDWLLVAGSLDATPLAVNPDWDVTLLIAGSDISGRSACNHYFAGASIDGESVTIDGVGGTEMACEPQVMDLEFAYTAALVRVTTAIRTGHTLRLTGDGVTLDYEIIEPVPAAELVGTTWVLDTIIHGDAASSTVGSAVEATLLLDTDGTFTGGTGCRNISGEYVIGGGTVQFTSWSAEGDCADEVQTQDGDVIAALEGPFTVKIDGERLTVTAAGGDALSYTARR